MKIPTKKLICFPVLHCNQHCAYCINDYGTFSGSQLPSNLNRRLSPWSKWAEALSSVDVSEIHITGGEPTLHPDFPSILSSVARGPSVLLATNASDKSVDQLSRTPKRDDVLIVISYHATQTAPDKFAARVSSIRSMGWKVVIHSPGGISDQDRITIASGCGVDVSSSHMITDPDGRSSDKHASTCGTSRTVDCPTWDYLAVSPEGKIYTCHALMYANSAFGVIGDFFGGELDCVDRLTCKMYGHCNPCDIGRWA